MSTWAIFWLGFNGGVALMGGLFLWCLSEPRHYNKET